MRYAIINSVLMGLIVCFTSLVMADENKPVTQPDAHVPKPIAIIPQDGLNLENAYQIPELTSNNMDGQYHVPFDLIRQMQPGLFPPTLLPDPINVVNNEACMNVALVEHISPDWVLLHITSKPCNDWFFFKLTGVQNRTVTVSITGDDIDVNKWKSLYPVYSYVENVNLPESFEWFIKSQIPPADLWPIVMQNDGSKIRQQPAPLKTPVWWSGDWLRPAAERGPFDGEYPSQHIIPKKSEGEFFYQGMNNYWQPWQDITQIEIVPVANAFRFTQHFSQNTVYIAMRYPFTPSLLGEIANNLKSNKSSLAQITTTGSIKDGNDNYGLFIPHQSTKTMGILSFYAREHATESDTSWVTLGVLHNTLESDSITSTLNNIDIAIIPIIDTANAKISSCITYIPPKDDHPVRLSLLQSQKKYVHPSLSAWLESKHQESHRGVSVDLHNVESSEMSGVWLPYFDERIHDKRDAIIADFKGILDANGIDLQSMPSWRGHEYRRVFGRIMTERKNTIGLPVEVNSRQMKHPLSLQDLDKLGALLIDISLEVFEHETIDSQEGEHIHE